MLVLVYQTKKVLCRLPALSCGLLPIVHEYDVTNQVLDSFGVFKDMENEGVLEDAIRENENRKIDVNEIVDFAFEKYSWESLGKEYVQMIKKVLTKN